LLESTNNISKDLNRFFKFCINDLSGIYTINNNIICTLNSEDGNNEPVMIKIGKKKKKLFIYNDNMPIDDNLVLLNPLNQTLTETKDQKWFYLILVFSLIKRLIDLFYYVKDLLKDEKELDTTILKYISSFHKLYKIKNIEKHFDKITDDRLEFCNIFYKRKIKSSSFRMNIFENDIYKNFPKSYKKSIDELRNFYTTVLQIKYNNKKDDLESIIKELFTVKSKSLVCPKLESILTLYLKIYERLNEFCIGIGLSDLAIDIDELSYHINNLEKYYDRIQWVGTGSNQIEEGDKIVFNKNIRNLKFSNKQDIRRDSSIPVFTKEQDLGGFNNINMNRQNPFNMTNPFGNIGFNNNVNNTDTNDSNVPVFTPVNKRLF
jgi:hypothetical protein